MTHIEECETQILAGGDIGYAEALVLARTEEPAELWAAADRLRRQLHGERFDLCSIINARSGKCSEDCRFCGQSARYRTEIDTYEMVSFAEVRQQGLENERWGVSRYSLVTAGKEVSDTDIETLAVMYERLGSESGLFFCASMGLLTPLKAQRLVAAGVKRYHCNLETARSFFPNVCTSHTWDDKVATIRIASEAGLEVCSGGIIGLGEGMEHRLELAFELRELGVRSIPINILTPIAGTPLAALAPPTLSEVLSCIALFRFINPRAVIRLAGGRAQLGAEQYRCFRAGANGAIVGNYLTTAGNGIAEDLRMLETLGYQTGKSKKE